MTAVARMDARFQTHAGSRGTRHADRREPSATPAQQASETGTAADRRLSAAAAASRARRFYHLSLPSCRSSSRFLRMYSSRSLSYCAREPLKATHASSSRFRSAQ